VLFRSRKGCLWTFVSNDLHLIIKSSCLKKRIRMNGQCTKTNRPKEIADFNTFDLHFDLEDNTIFTCTFCCDSQTLQYHFLRYITCELMQPFRRCSCLTLAPLYSPLKLVLKSKP